MLCKGLVTGGPTFLKVAGLLSCTVGRLVLSLPSYWIFKWLSPVLGENQEALNTLKLFAVNLPGASSIDWCVWLLVGWALPCQPVQCILLPSTLWLGKPSQNTLDSLGAASLLSSSRPKRWHIIIKRERVWRNLWKDTPISSIAAGTQKLQAALLCMEGVCFICPNIPPKSLYLKPSCSLCLLTVGLFE